LRHANSSSSIAISNDATERKGEIIEPSITDARDIFVILRKPAWMTQVRSFLLRQAAIEHDANNADNVAFLVSAIKIMRSETLVGLYEAVNVTKMVYWLLLGPESVGPEQPRVRNLHPKLKQIATEIAA